MFYLKCEFRLSLSINVTYINELLFLLTLLAFHYDQIEFST